MPQCTWFIFRPFLVPTRWGVEHPPLAYSKTRPRGPYYRSGLLLYQIPKITGCGLCNLCHISLSTIAYLVYLPFNTFWVYISNFLEPPIGIEPISRRYECLIIAVILRRHFFGAEDRSRTAAWRLRNACTATILIRRFSFFSSFRIRYCFHNFLSSHDGLGIILVNSLLHY